MKSRGITVLVMAGLSLASCLLGLVKGSQGFAATGLAVALASFLAYYAGEALVSLALAVLSSLLAVAATHSLPVSLIPVVQALVAVTYKLKPMRQSDLAYYLLAIMYAVSASIFVILFSESYAAIRGPDLPRLAGLKNILYLASIPLISSLSYRSTTPTSTVEKEELLGPLPRVDARRVFRYIIYTLALYDTLTRPWMLPGVIIGFIAMKLTTITLKHRPEISLIAFIAAYSIYGLIS